MLSLLYDEHNKLHTSLVALPKPAARALLQIGGECYYVAPYIVYLPESFFSTFSRTVLYSGVIIIDQRITTHL